MSARETYPKRLIEVDLPIRRISAHARREKSIRHGHISTLHPWWARRPLAACRAVILAALWPDPADPNCPEKFRVEAIARMRALRDRRGGPARDWDDPQELRTALLDFIADFSDWDLANERDYLETSRSLVQIAHEVLGGTPGTRPLILDPFAGGGAIPVEALRMGAQCVAADINPVAVLLNRVTVEHLPHYGDELLNAYREASNWITAQLGERVEALFPGQSGEGKPITYLWARTIRCEGPSCGIEIPLVRSTQLSARDPLYHLLITASSERVEVELSPGRELRSSSTVKAGAATCPRCKYTTPASRVKQQLIPRRGGADQARLLAVLVDRNGIRTFRPPNALDVEGVSRACGEAARPTFQNLRASLQNEISRLRPYKNTVGVSIVGSLGIATFRDLFTTRQFVTLAMLQELATEAAERHSNGTPEATRALLEVLQLTVDRVVAANCSLCRWDSSRSTVKGAFSKQALQVIWDFAEINPASPGSGGWVTAVDYVERVLSHCAKLRPDATVLQSAAQELPLPDNLAQLLFTDPPYFAAIPYGDLSEFFYVWLRPALAGKDPALFGTPLIERNSELIVTNAQRGPEGQAKDNLFFSTEMALALKQCRRIVEPQGIGCIVFADASTDAWEAMLGAVLSAGWIVTASWPLDTEMANRTRARKSASLQSSIHIVCRPRETSSSSMRSDSIGDWRDVLAELPKRIHEWMPRLAAEGVVGADAIFACLGPALEVFSRYSHVEKASGEAVLLKEYLEHIWAAVAKEALEMIFTGADATGFEEDARLTAMWLWTLSPGGSNGNNGNENDEGEASEDDEDESANAKSKVGGFVLEYDAARKIAQGLGAHLEQLASLVEVKGATARLLPVAERTRSLFQKRDAAAPIGRGKAKKKSAQLSLGFVADLEEAEASGGWGETGAPNKGETVLDRVHQAMILFGAGRGEALKRFLVDDGAGRDNRFWRLAQAFSALYPSSTDEKRWVDGVLARKKSLGF